jgi:glycosyltransferase involved in cell wall biosynthesis
MRGSHFRPNFNHFTAFGKRLVRSGCAMVSAALVQADCLRDQFEGLVPEERIKTLYQAIDSTEYGNPDLSNYQKGKILFLGNMTKAKGYCDLVRAITLVVKRHPEANFYFAGGLRKGERGVFFNQITGQQLAYEDPFAVHDEITCGVYKNHYHALGVVADGEKLDLLRSSDIFVLPSYSEGFSRALLEAMCVGKPVVCTAVGAHREVIQDEVHGLVVPPGDVAALANCICRLLEDRQLRDQIAHTNYRRVREDFDITGIAKQFSSILENCTKES